MALPAHTLVVYPFGFDRPGVEIRCANGFVSRCVSAVAENNIGDAERLAAILNAHADAEHMAGVVRALEEARAHWRQEAARRFPMPEAPAPADTTSDFV